MAKPYRLRMLRTADKSLLRAPVVLQRRIRDAIGALADDPRRPGVVKLKGRDGYRLRVGIYRVLFAIDDGARTVTIAAIGPRRDIYRQ